MATKIVIDAGHGGSVDPGAVYKGREEKNDNLNLAMAVGKILSENGVDVVYTRTDDTYQTPFEKAQIANEDGADFFLSFHRNSSPLPNQYSGAESLVYDLSVPKVLIVHCRARVPKKTRDIISAIEKPEEYSFFTIFESR